MTNLIFTDENGNKYKRIDKRIARKLYDDGTTIFLCACNLRPFTMWHCQIDINKNDFTKYGYSETNDDFLFNRRVNNFEFYNCVNNETGKRANYYILFE